MSAASVRRAWAGACDWGLAARWPTRARAAAMQRGARRSSVFLRLDDELDAPPERQPFQGGGLNVGWRQRRVAREILGEVVGPAAGCEIRVELIGFPAEPATAFNAAIERRLDFVQRPLDLARVRRLALQARELLVDHGIELRRGMTGTRRRDDLELAAERGRSLKCRHVLRDLQVVNEPLVEPRILAAREHGGDDVERGVTRREVPRCEPGEIQARQAHSILERFASYSGEARGRGADGHDLGAAR